MNPKRYLDLEEDIIAPEHISSVTFQDKIYHFMF